MGPSQKTPHLYPQPSKTKPPHDHQKSELHSSAKVIGVERARSQPQTCYDPTCGSGTLLLKVAAETGMGLSPYGQENEGLYREELNALPLRA